MELREFIVQTMKGITDGIADCETQGVKIKKDNFNDVLFDVAVTVENGSNTGLGGSIKVLGISLNRSLEDKGSTTAVSRINFHITHEP